MHHPASILLVEDDDTDVLFFRRALKEADVQNPLHVARDGQEAIDFLTQPRPEEQDRLPGLIVLDLQMPCLNGFEVLSWLREQTALGTIPVFIFSSSANHDDIERAYALGANAYVVKPPSLAERLEVARLVKQWLRCARPPLASHQGLGIAQREHARRRYRQSPAGERP